MRKRLLLFCVALMTSGYLTSCCEPRIKNAAPFVIDSSFTTTPVHDRVPVGGPTDSGYYPIYSVAIKNIGSESDTFSLRYQRFGFTIQISRLVEAGATETFTTPGPLPDTVFPSAQHIYYTFFAEDSSGVEINKLRPTMTVRYGSVDNGPEACNTSPSEATINVDKLKQR